MSSTMFWWTFKLPPFRVVGEGYPRCPKLSATVDDSNPASLHDLIYQNLENMAG